MARLILPMHGDAMAVKVSLSNRTGSGSIPLRGHCLIVRLDIKLRQPPAEIDSGIPCSGPNRATVWRKFLAVSSSLSTLVSFNKRL